MARNSPRPGNEHESLIVMNPQEPGLEQDSIILKNSQAPRYEQDSPLPPPPSGELPSYVTRFPRSAGFLQDSTTFRGHIIGAYTLTVMMLIWINKLTDIKGDTHEIFMLGFSLINYRPAANFNPKIFSPML
jgi:hypothetical protein